MLTLKMEGEGHVPRNRGLCKLQMALDLQLGRAQGPLLSTWKGLNSSNSWNEQEKHFLLEPPEGKEIYI